METENPLSGEHAPRLVVRFLGSARSLADGRWVLAGSGAVLAWRRLARRGPGRTAAG